MKQRREPRWKSLMCEMKGGDKVAAFEAAKKLRFCRSRNRREALIAELKSGDDGSAEAAAFAAREMDDRWLLPALAACVRDVRRTPSVRGEAADSIGFLELCRFGRQDELSRIAEDALIEAVGDSSAEVRFWCCYTLGVMRSRRAIPRLEKLRDTDSTMVPGWWRVGEEAADALEWLAGRQAPEREMGAEG